MKKVIIILSLIIAVDSAFAQTTADYRKDAKKGDTVAQYNFGQCYYKGDGVKKKLFQSGVLVEKSSKTGTY